MKKKSIFQRLSLFAILAASILTISTTSATAEASRVVYFTIQNNGVCNSTTFGSELYLHINNVSDTPNNVTLYLYKKDGTAFSLPGSNNYAAIGIVTDSGFIPGTSVTIQANSTIQYFGWFGQESKVACSERPTHGKIVVNSNSGHLMAGGNVQGRKLIVTSSSTPPSTNTLFQDTPIIINEGKPF
ncbi:hypothetical protein [Paenibacillus paridis]|uniref:hypothetical protein n=1 Tax=Paenibacillus paridis TaxID=2583376 RepID=UPI0011217B0D|nr:hypothetical protein [Paenibacillus paridis]